MAGEPADPAAQQRTLVRYMQLSLAAALVTIALKALAAVLTGSVGFLSDALESLVNLVAAMVALAALHTAARPPDEHHDFGHGKAEYLSAGAEGVMIFVAAAAIVWSAADRLANPVPLDQPGVGLALSTGASLINLSVAAALIRAGRAHRSITLVADGKHLLTDVMTSAGVLAGIAAVAVTGWDTLDPLVALGVGANILRMGWVLIRRATVGLLDATLPDEEVAQVRAVVDRYQAVLPVDFHALRTRESGRQRFVYLDVLVPGEWTVQAGHDLVERIEADIARELPGTRTFTHLEPREDPASYGHDGVGPPPAGAAARRPPTGRSAEEPG